MKLIVTKDYAAMSQAGAKLFIDLIKNKPDAVLGLATGSTPIGLYKELIKAHQEGLDFSRLTTFNLDEYLGLASDHEQSYNYFMHTELFNHVNIPEEHIHMPDGLLNDIKAFSAYYEDAIQQAGGIDLQLLGVGENGHIAFNEPGETLSAVTFVSELTEDTIEVNSRFFDDVKDVPTQAVSMGMGSILSAKKIVMMANGEKKRPVMERLLRDQTVSTDFPISFLKCHPDVTLIVDEEAMPIGWEQ